MSSNIFKPFPFSKYHGKISRVRAALFQEHVCLQEMQEEGKGA